MNRLLIHGFSPVNAQLLIRCDTAFYAIMHVVMDEKEHMSQGMVKPTITCATSKDSAHPVHPQSMSRVPVHPS